MVIEVADSSVATPEGSCNQATAGYVSLAGQEISELVLRVFLRGPAVLL